MQWEAMFLSRRWARGFDYRAVLARTLSGFRKDRRHPASAHDRGFFYWLLPTRIPAVSRRIKRTPPRTEWVIARLQSCNW